MTSLLVLVVAGVVSGTSIHCMPTVFLTACQVSHLVVHPALYVHPCDDPVLQVRGLRLRNG